MTKENLIAGIMLAIIGAGMLAFMVWHSSKVDSMIEDNGKYSVVCDVNDVCGFRD